MVVGGDSCLKGREFESGRTFSHTLVVKFVICTRKDENK